jgi:hypothetical protein
MQERLLLNFILASLGSSPQDQFVAELIHRNIVLEDELAGKITAEKLRRESDLKKLSDEMFTLETSLEDLFKQVKARDYEGMTRHTPAGSPLAQLGAYLVLLLKNNECLALKNTALIRFKERVESITESESNDGNKVSLIIEDATALRRYLRTLD